MRKLRALWIRLRSMCGAAGRTDEQLAADWKAICRCTSMTICVPVWRRKKRVGSD